MRFKKGNPGRPRGTKNKVSEEYLQALAKDFDLHGTEVIETVRTRQPAVYLRLVEKLILKDRRYAGGVDAQAINALPDLTTDQWSRLRELLQEN